jgi:Lrp/AsnC family transcriptional regulator, leucine-responsive regulatory protein
MDFSCKLRSKIGAFVPKSGSIGLVLDRFDLSLLDIVQRDDSLTAEELAARVPLSPSAIARRLRRLRRDGVIARTIALLSPRLGERRLRAFVLVQLAEHADRAGKAAVLARLDSAEHVQFVYEISGEHDLVLLFDCRDMDEFVTEAERLLAGDPIVRRYETSFVKREWKFAPFVRLG